MLRINNFDYKESHCIRTLRRTFSRKHLYSIFLLMMTVTALTFACSFLLQSANATYVWGPITKDTVWTLVDSPFVISNDVTVYPGATLTIEPGVAIRFGGDFSIIVEGQLIANGTQDRMITFTSNAYQPVSGDWNAIEFNSTQPSLLAYCTIAYAKMGIDATNSVADIENSTIINNQQYGISVINSIMTIRANVISNNSVSGVYVSGHNHVTIQNNTIETNADGILLNGTVASGINISQNIVLSNTQSGIHLNANSYNNSLTILHNIVSANQWGFYITGPPSTQITNNTISYNKIGLFYEAGSSHVAHWNNIIDNVMGMAVSPAIESHSVYVNVTDNAGAYTLSNTAVVSPSGTFSASVSPSNASLTTSQPELFTSSVSGGTPPYFYQWYLNGVLVSGATNETWMFTPSSSGSFLIDCRVTDDSGMEAPSSTAVVSVNGAFSVSIVPGLAILGAGQSQLFNSSVSGGTPPYFYQWYVDGVSALGDTNSKLLFTVPIAEVVNATYNYWGDQSGPYNRLLNPAGKGNPVGGDGSDLVFIFWCTAPIGYLDHHPSAWLWADKQVVAPNQLVTFFGTNSSNDRYGRVDFYFFNFGDGQNSGWTTLSVLVHNYTSAGTYNATLKVMDDFGVVSNNSAGWTISCQTLPSLAVSLIPSSSSVDSSGQVSATVQVRNTSSPMNNANVVLFSILGGRFQATAGLTNSSGYFTTMFSAPSVTAMTNIRIVASASEAGYADGSNYAYLTVWPALTVSIAPNPGTIKSEATTSVTMSVMSNGVPVSNAAVTVSSNSTGSFSQTTGVTDANGSCTFTFTAPQTSTYLEISITGTATMSGYIEGQGQTLLTVEPNVLVVQLWQNATAVTSGATENVVIGVSSNGALISNAAITMSSNSTGSFSQTTGVTDANGNCTFTFTAPQTSTYLEVKITATATMSGYAEGQGQTLLTIMPKVLVVQITPSSAAVNSEMSSNVTVHVAYSGQPVSNATVVVSSVSGGSFSPANATTDSNGSCVFVFTAPQVITPTNTTITATAIKVGYAKGTNQTIIAVDLGTLSVQVSSYPGVVDSKATSQVTVYVSYNGQPVANAAVNVSSGIPGTFLVPNGTTNANGDCVFTFTAPELSHQSFLSITANAAEVGYLDGQGQTSITVNSAGSLLSLPIILLMVAIVALVVVVLILIKIKVIVISTGEGK